MSSLLGCAAGCAASAIISFSSQNLAKAIVEIPFIGRARPYASTIGSICGAFPVSIALLTSLPPSPVATGFKIATVAISLYNASVWGTIDAQNRQLDSTRPDAECKEVEEFMSKHSLSIKKQFCAGVVVAATTSAVFGPLAGHCLGVASTYGLGSTYYQISKETATA